MYSNKHRTTRNVRCKDKKKNGTIAYITKKYALFCVFYSYSVQKVLKKTTQKEKWPVNN